MEKNKAEKQLLDWLNENNVFYKIRDFTSQFNTKHKEIVIGCITIVVSRETRNNNYIKKIYPLNNDNVLDIINSLKEICFKKEC